MFDMRAYVISLTAVFLALGVGILLGTVIVGRGTVNKQQSVILKSIESKVIDVANDNRALKKSLEDSEQFQREILPLAVQGRLTGRTVAILHNEDASDETLKVAEEVIKQASGTPVSITLRNKLFDKDAAEKLNSSITLPNESTTESVESPASQITMPRLIAESIAAPGNDLNIMKLREQEFISFNVDQPQAFSSVLLVLNQKDKVLINQFYEPMVSDLGKYGLPIVAAEVSDIKDSIVYKLKSPNVSTIDSLDRVWGKISLVYTLSGRAGKYGQKIGANTILPEPDENL